MNAYIQLFHACQAAGLTNYEAEQFVRATHAEDTRFGMSEEYAAKAAKAPVYLMLGTSFNWSKSPQGHDYWAEVHTRLCSDTMS